MHVRLLGEFNLDYENRAITGLASPRLQSLLAYLLLHRDSPTPRQQLAFLFWPDSAEAQALTNLRKLLFLLHRALPDLQGFLLEERRGLQIRPNGAYFLDVDNFEAAMRSSQDAAQREDEAALRAALEQAVAIYKGDLLPSCYDDWIIAARERLHRSFFAGLERLIDLLESYGELTLAIAYARRLVQHDPLHEPTYRRLMKLHASERDRNSVHRVYQECSKILRREFDVEPTRATQQLYKRLTATSELSLPARQGPPIGAAPGEPSATNVSVPPTSFLGRELELATALRLLRDPSVRLLTITGPLGIGKTRLAAEVALRLRDEFGDGVFFVDLARVTEPDYVLPAISEVVELPESNGRPLPDRLKSFLHDRQMLLLLDNFEHLLPAAARLSVLLTACPNLKLLITSRSPLHLRGENELRLPPLLLSLRGHYFGPEQLGRFAAIQLFVERARIARPDFALTEQNAAVVAEIVRRLDGLPLAIEWAAARIRYLSAEVMLSRMENRLKLLVQGARDLADRQQSLRHAVAWSYDLLAEGEQKLFRRLAVFSGGYDLSAAEAVCNPADELGIDMLDELMMLVDKSLLQQHEAASPDRLKLRFDMLELIREYALERLQECAEAEQLYARHAAYFLDPHRQAEALAAGSGGAAWAERERDNILAAQEWMARHPSVAMA